VLRRESAVVDLVSTQVLVELALAVEVGLVAEIIRKTANCRVPPNNITLREQMPIVFDDHRAHTAASTSFASRAR
jgi:hypothetical protein